MTSLNFSHKFRACLLITASVLVFSTALAVRAESTAPNDFGLKQTADLAGLPTGNPDPTTIIATVINTVVGLVGVIAVVLILLGGFRWMTSGGNEENIAKAKGLLTSAIIGLFIVLASYTIANFVINTLKKATIQPSNSQQYGPPAPETCDALTGATCVTVGSCSTTDLGPKTDCEGPTLTCCSAE